MLRNASKISNYNFREHAQRRVKEEFRLNKDIAGDLLRKKYEFGVQQSEIIKRHSIISNIYKEASTVMSH